MEHKINKMKNLLLEKLPEEGLIDMGIGSAALFRSDKPYKKKPQLYQPHIILLAQGKKKIFLGDKEFLYDPYNYFVQTVSPARRMRGGD